MGRKKQTRFQWVQGEGDEPPVMDYIPREARSELKDRLAEQKRLVKRMVGMTAGQRRALPLDDAVLDALDLLADTRPSPGRKRQLLRTQGMLRDVDLDALEAAIDGDTAQAAGLARVERWRARLLGDQADDALQELFDTYPDADRQQIRNLVRAAGAEGTAGKRGRRKLFAELRDLVGEIDGDVGEEPGAEG